MELDVLGLACPVPRLKAAAALRAISSAEELVVLADDPEAAIDLAALAADHGRDLTRAGSRYVLSPVRPRRPGAGPPRR